MRGGALRDPSICIDDNNSVQNTGRHPEAAVLAIRTNLVSIKRQIDDERDEQALEDTLENVPRQLLKIIVLIVEADPIVLGLRIKGPLGKFFIKHSEPHDRERREDNVITLVNERFVQCLSAEGRCEPEPILSHDEKLILVEHVGGEGRIPSVSLPAMVEYEHSEELEL